MSLETIPLKSIAASPTNPRKTFDEVKLKELADNIAEIGQIHPITVRPKPGAKLDDLFRFEIVCGERRYRALRLAKADTILAIIKNLTDAQVLEHQIVENNQREDVDPIEESASFSQYCETHGHTPEDIAAKIGRPVRYVKDRIALAGLCDDAKTALAEDYISIGHALYLARFDHDIQTLALMNMDVLDQDWKQGKYVPRPGSFTEERTSWTIAALKEWYVNESTLDITKAVWQLDQTFDHAGPCTTCLKRTINNPTLFEDDTPSEDLCGDKACWNLKRDAFMANALEQSKKGQGLPLIDTYKKSSDGILGDDKIETRSYLDVEEVKAGKHPGVMIGISNMPHSLGQEIAYKLKGTKEKVEKSPELQLIEAKEKYQKEWRPLAMQEIVNFAKDHTDLVFTNTELDILLAKDFLASTGWELNKYLIEWFGLDAEAHSYGVIADLRERLDPSQVFPVIVGVLTHNDVRRIYMSGTESATPWIDYFSQKFGLTNMIEEIKKTAHRHIDKVNGITEDNKPTQKPKTAKPKKEKKAKEEATAK